MATKQDYQETVKTRLGEMEAQIEALMAQATRSDYDEYLTDLRTKQERAKVRLAELEQANGDAWQDIKTELYEAVRDVQNALSVATADSG